MHRDVENSRPDTPLGKLWGTDRVSRCKRDAWPCRFRRSSSAASRRGRRLRSEQPGGRRRSAEDPRRMFAFVGELRTEGCSVPRVLAAASGSCLEEGARPGQDIDAGTFIRPIRAGPGRTRRRRRRVGCDRGRRVWSWRGWRGFWRWRRSYRACRRSLRWIALRR